MTDPSIKNCKGEIPLQLVESASVVAELLKYTNTTTYTTNEKHAVSKFLESNPLCAEEFFDHCIGTNGKDEDSKDLLITFDLSPFKPEGTSKARKIIKGDEFTAFSNMVQRFVKDQSRTMKLRKAYRIIPIYSAKVPPQPSGSPAHPDFS